MYENDTTWCLPHLNISTVANPLKSEVGIYHIIYTVTHWVNLLHCMIKNKDLKAHDYKLTHLRNELDKRHKEDYTISFLLSNTLAILWWSLWDRFLWERVDWISQILHMNCFSRQHLLQTCIWVVCGSGHPHPTLLPQLGDRMCSSYAVV